MVLEKLVLFLHIAPMSVSAHGAGTGMGQLFSQAQPFWWFSFTAVPGSWPFAFGRRRTKTAQKQLFCNYWLLIPPCFAVRSMFSQKQLYSSIFFFCWAPSKWPLQT